MKTFRKSNKNSLGVGPAFIGQVGEETPFTNVYFITVARFLKEIDTTRKTGRKLEWASQGHCTGWQTLGYQ
jgi:hypothetical protein